MPHHVLLALDWYDQRIHRGVVRVAAGLGWRVESNALRPGTPVVPADWRGDGAIALLNRAEAVRLLAARCRHVVDLGLGATPWQARTVVDNAAIARLAADHLLGRGYRSLAVCGIPGVRMFDERTAAFIAAAAAAGVDARPLPLRRLAAALVRLPRPTAVFAAQDHLGAQVIATALAAGLRVPQDLAVLGVDDQELICEALPVPLASIDTGLEALGEAAARRLARMLDGQADSGAIHRMPPRRVVLRASAGHWGTAHPGLLAAIDLGRRQPNAGVPRLAQAAGLSVPGLAKACRRELGLTPGRLLRGLRLDAARAALAGGTPLAEAARAAGLPSAGALCGLFRRQLRDSPGGWRRRARPG